jgi:hypothetical protein
VLQEVADVLDGHRITEPLEERRRQCDFLTPTIDPVL